MTQQDDIAHTAQSFHTAIALFDSVPDARDVLSSLAQREYSSSRIFILMRDQTADDSSQDQRSYSVAQALSSIGLENSAEMLHNPVLLIIPERGTFLASGPIVDGLLHISSTGQPENSSAHDHPVVHPAGDQTIFRALAALGFGAEEAAFLDHRLMAGLVMTGVQGSSTEDLQDVRELYATESAIHIGMAACRNTANHDRDTIDSIAPDARSDDDVIVTDLIANLSSASQNSEMSAEYRNACKRSVHTRDGEEIGSVYDVLITSSTDATDADIKSRSRYLIIEHGGLLGIGAHFSVVPIELVAFGEDAIRLNIDRETLKNAPVYNPDIALSRREEQVICGYFGITPYWQTAE